MTDIKWDKISERVAILERKQSILNREIQLLKSDIKIESISKDEEPPLNIEIQETKQREEPIPIIANREESTPPPIMPPPIKPSPTKISPTEPLQKKRSIETFIGTNLINKIGIIVTIIGMGIGINYSIEHDLISPLTRIVIGYLLGAGLLLLGLKLKKKYKEYSAVLVSGAMASLYFITFFAYSIYGFIPLTATFAIMCLTTAATVLLSLKYNMSVIAHIALLGAYGVPFLINSGSDNAFAFFIYIGVVDIAVLIIFLKRVWGSLLYSTFVLTWALLAIWLCNGVVDNNTFYTAVTLFFLTFYSIVVMARLKHKEKFASRLLLMLISNAVIAYGLGFIFFDITTSIVEADGLIIYTMISALVHSLVATTLYILGIHSRDRTLFYLTVLLAISSITILIPVTLDGSVLTTLWITEAAILFIVGKLQSIAEYKRYSFAILIMAIVSFIHDYDSIVTELFTYSSSPTDIDPIFNSYFGSMLLFTAILYAIHYFNSQPKFNKTTPEENQLDRFISSALQFTGIGVMIALYLTLTCEIEIYFNYQSIDTDQIVNRYDGCVGSYSALIRVVMLIAAIHFKMLRRKNSAIPIWIVLALSIYNLIDLYELSGIYIILRYLFWGAIAALLYKWRTGIDSSNSKQIKTFDMTLYPTLIIGLTTELIYFTESILNYDDAWNIWVSILWAIFGVLLIVKGIKSGKKYLRLSAISILGITILKLLIIDLSNISSGGKTILLIAVGALLLIGSFIYNKNRDSL